MTIWFKLIEIQKQESQNFPNYRELHLNKETEFGVYEFSKDQYGNIYKKCLFNTDDVVHAKKFLRSCRLIDGIEVEQ